MEIIDISLLNSVTEDAKKSSRLRMNYNFHKHLDDKAQKLLNALEPGTIIPIHRHQYTSETYILLRGQLKVLFYDSSKTLIQTCNLNPDEGNFGVEIPSGQWHSVEALESGTVIFEVKEGPYSPLSAEDIL
jgi:cupin fold WbuC family metalloprotein